MTETPPTESSAAPPTRRYSYAWAMMILSIFVCLANLFFAIHVIPLFAGIYRDMLGKEPLPIITTWVLHSRLIYVSLAVFWPSMAIWEFRQRTRYFGAVLILVSAIEVMFTVIALMEPIAGTIIKQAPG